MELRDALLLILASAVALVFAHGVWRAYFGQPKLKIKLDKQFRNSSPIPVEDELSMLKAELPNGGARIISASGEVPLSDSLANTSRVFSESETQQEPAMRVIDSSELGTQVSAHEVAGADHAPLAASNPGSEMSPTKRSGNAASGALDEATVGDEGQDPARSHVPKVSDVVSASDQGSTQFREEPRKQRGLTEHIQDDAHQSGPTMDQPMSAEMTSARVGVDMPSTREGSIDSAKAHPPRPTQTTMFEEPRAQSDAQNVRSRSVGDEAAAASSTVQPQSRPHSRGERAATSGLATEEQPNQTVKKARKPAQRKVRPPVVVHLIGKMSLDRLAPVINNVGWSVDPVGVFHFYSGEGERCFTLTNLVEPGVFDFDEPSISVPGVSLILSLNDVSDPVWAYRILLREAAKLADVGQALMTDGRRQPLTLESIEAMTAELASVRPSRRRARASA